MSDCLTYAIHYLSKYPKTAHEARAVLRKKGFTTEEIEEAIPALIQSGYLNDKGYAEAYLHSEVVRKGKPLILIRQKLLMKGVEKGLLNEIIEQLEIETTEGQQAKISKEILRLRAKEKNDPEIVQTLVKKGFPYRLVLQTLQGMSE